LFLFLFDYFIFIRNLFFEIKGRNKLVEYELSGYRIFFFYDKFIMKFYKKFLKKKV